MRPILILLIILLQGAALFGGEKENLDFSAGYHYDVIDYDREPQQFFRHRYTVTDKGKKIFLSHTALDNFGKHHVNWYISLGEDRGFSVTGGSFNVRLGSGLLYGARRYTSGDVLSFRESWREAVPVKPSASANPYYSLKGLVLGYREGTERRGWGIHCFASLRQRYVSSEDIDEGLLKLSPASLNSHTEETSRRYDKIYLRTGGAAGEATLGRYILLQVFSYYSDISDTEGDRLSWQGVGDLQPLRGAAGSGLLLQYRDASLSCLFEGLYSTGFSPSGAGKKNAWGGRGALRFKHRAFDFSTSLVTTGKGFYAPESGESVRPFTRGDILLRHRFKKIIEIRAMMNSEIHRVPGGWHRSMPVTIREAVTLLWKPSKWIFEGEVKNARYEKEETGWNRQYRCSGSWNVPDIFRIRGRFLVREKNGTPLSRAAGMDIRGNLMKWITLSGIYYWCDAAAGNSIYISTGAVPGRVSVASRIDGREHRFAAGAVMKFAKIQILGRYEAAMKERKLFSWHLDISCSGKF